MVGIKIVFMALMCLCLVSCEHSLKIKEPQFHKRRTPESNVAYLDKINAQAAKKSARENAKKSEQYEFISHSPEAVPEQAVVQMQDENQNTSQPKPREIWSEDDDDDDEYDDITSMQVAEEPEPEVETREAPIKIIKRHEATSSKYVQIKPRTTTKKNAAKIQAKAVTTTTTVAAPTPTSAPVAPPTPPVPQQPAPELQPPIPPTLDTGLPPRPNLKINKIPPKTQTDADTQELMANKQAEAKALADNAQTLQPVQPQQVAPQPTAPTTTVEAAPPPPSQLQQPTPSTSEPSANMDEKLQELLKSYDNPTK